MTERTPQDANPLFTREEAERTKDYEYHAYAHHSTGDRYGEQVPDGSIGRSTGWAERPFQERGRLFETDFTTPRQIEISWRTPDNRQVRGQYDKSEIVELTTWREIPKLQKASEQAVASVYDAYITARVQVELKANAALRKMQGKRTRGEMLQECMRRTEEARKLRETQETVQPQRRDFFAEQEARMQKARKQKTAQQEHTKGDEIER